MAKTNKKANKTVIATSVGVFSFLILIAVLANLPARLFLEDSFGSVNYTDLGGATFFSGDIWLDLEDIKGPAHLVYQWCPGLNPISWCIDLTHSAFAITGVISLLGTQNIGVSDMDIQSVDITSLGLASGFLDARINGRIETMNIPLSDCPIKGVKELEGQFSTTDVRILGFIAGAHRLDLSSDEMSINASLSGDTFVGEITLNNGKYHAMGEMTAPESMESMARSFMRPLGNNQFGWEISGDLPC